MSKELEVNGDKFDKAYHDPVYMAKKLKHIEYKISVMTAGLKSLMEDAKGLITDLSLHRQNMLNAVKKEKT